MPVAGDTGVAAQAPERTVIALGDVRIEIWAQGEGPLIVLLPSLGRGAADFEPIASRLAQAGYRVLRPQPRGIGRSNGPLTGIDLHDYAADVATVIANENIVHENIAHENIAHENIAHEKLGSAFVVGHAFGNRVARMLATDRPELVRAVALVAAKIGKAPSPPEVRAAIRNSADASLSDEERVKALRFAFFAPGNDPRGWLEGWYPQVLAAAIRAFTPVFAGYGVPPAIAPRGKRTSPADGRRSSTCSPVTIRWRMWKTPRPTRRGSATA